MKTGFLILTVFSSVLGCSSNTKKSSDRAEIYLFNQARGHYVNGLYETCLRELRHMRHFSAKVENSDELQTFCQDGLELSVRLQLLAMEKPIQQRFPATSKDLSAFVEPDVKLKLPEGWSIERWTQKGDEYAAHILWLKAPKEGDKQITAVSITKFLNPSKYSLSQLVHKLVSDGYIEFKVVNISGQVWLGYSPSPEIPSTGRSWTFATIKNSTSWQVSTYSDYRQLQFERAIEDVLKSLEI